MSEYLYLLLGTVIMIILIAVVRKFKLPKSFYSNQKKRKDIIKKIQ